MYGKYSAIYDEWSRCYDPQNIEMQTINKYVNFKNASVLEIGCGTGRFTRRIADDAKRIIAIDNDINSIEYAKTFSTFKNVEYLLLSGFEIDETFNDTKFDYIIFSWSLNYIDDKEKIIKLARDLLTKNGKIIILFTALGEYELMLKSVVGESRISNDDYLIASRILKENTNVEIEKTILAPFIFKNLEDAMKLNLFFFECDGYEITTELKENLQNKLQKHVKKDKTVQIMDTVNLIIGGKNV